MPSRPPLPLPAPPPLAVPADLAPRLAELGVSLPPEAVDQVADYLARLLAMNEVMNLTAVTDPEEAWTRHALDGLSLIPELDGLRAGGRVLDLGSGGGVPGVLIAIARPDLALTLVEATGKKAAFLTALCAALGLRVTVANDRAEQLGRGHLAGTIDCVTARAVGKLDVLAGWAEPFLRPGGRMIFIKGERAQAELEEARTTLARLGIAHHHTRPTPTGQVLVLENIGPARQPRGRRGGRRK